MIAHVKCEIIYISKAYLNSEIMSNVSHKKLLGHNFFKAYHLHDTKSGGMCICYVFISLKFQI